MSKKSKRTPKYINNQEKFLLNSKNGYDGHVSIFKMKKVLHIQSANKIKRLSEIDSNKQSKCQTPYFSQEFALRKYDLLFCFNPKRTRY